AGAPTGRHTDPHGHGRSSGSARVDPAGGLAAGTGVATGSAHAAAEPAAGALVRETGGLRAGRHALEAGAPGRPERAGGPPQGTALGRQGDDRARAVRNRSPGDGLSGTTGTAGFFPRRLLAEPGDNVVQ